MTRFLLLIIISSFFTGCVSVFMPRKQKITVATGQSGSVVFMDGEEFGTGASIRKKIKKTGIKKLIVKTPGYKDVYSVLPSTHRPPSYAFMQLLNLPFDVFAFFPAFIDHASMLGLAYDDVTTIPLKYKTLEKKPDQKFIDLIRIKLNIKNKEKDLYDFNIKSPVGVDKQIADAEKQKDTNEKKLEASKKKGKKRNLLEADDKRMLYNDTKFSEDISSLIETSGYKDSLENFFTDANNLMGLEAKINKVYGYKVRTKGLDDDFFKVKMFMTWYIKSNYNEIIDSLETNEFSGEFTYNLLMPDNDLSGMFSDAVENSFYCLMNNLRIQDHLKKQENTDIKEAGLSINTPSSIVADKNSAGEACVIVKTNKGHGSGFAISNNGYIITNYHVIAGKFDRQTEIPTIILSDGSEVKAEVIRVNKFKDLALLKINKDLAKAFKISSNRSFSSLQDVYTIGAPKSVELGQSVSTGIISNERKARNFTYLQLNMSVNSGNSGGPLFDANGNLHGVIVSKLVGNNTEGVSFAIPGYLLEKYLNISYK